MSHRLAVLTCLVVLGFAVQARSDIDVEIGNGDAVTGTIAPATETEVLRFRVPSGSTFKIKAKAAKKGPELHLRLLDPMGSEVITADGKAAAITTAGSAVSGVYSLEVTSRNGIATGDYSVSVAWKSPTSEAASAALASAASSILTFSADAGATATVSVKTQKGSGAIGVLTSLTGPGPSIELLVGTSAKRTLPSGGDYDLAFRNAGAAEGSLTATVKVKPPKPSKKKIGRASCRERVSLNV